MRLRGFPLFALAVLGFGCQDRAVESPGSPPAAEARQPEATAEPVVDAQQTFVVRLLSRTEADQFQSGSAARKEELKARPGFSDLVLHRPETPEDELALVEVTVWGSRSDARRAAAEMAGRVGVYEVIMRVGEVGPPVFGRPLDMLLFEPPNVSEPFFRAEVEVFARVSERSPGFYGLLLKNVEAGAAIPFIYFAQWGSEEAREEVHSSADFEAALNFARLQKTEVMNYLVMRRLD